MRVFIPPRSLLGSLTAAGAELTSLITSLPRLYLRQLSVDLVKIEMHQNFVRRAFRLPNDGSA